MSERISMFKRIITTVLVILMLACVCACTPEKTEQPTPTPTLAPTQTPELTPSPSPSPILKDDLTLSDFAIIFPEIDVLKGFKMRECAINLSNEILSVTGIKCRMSEDIIDEEQGFVENTYEILIGDTAREESSIADDKNMRYYDYVIKYVGTKLVINGGSDEAIVNALEYFVSNILKEDLTTVEGCKELLKTDIEYEYDSNITRMYIDGEYIKSFKVISELDDDLVNGVMDDILACSGERVTRGKLNKETEREIIIGECDREEYKQAVESLSRFEYVVEVVNGKLVIAGKTERGLNMALRKFREDYLGMKTEKLDITSSNDFKYDHKYPIASLKLCGYDISDYVIVTSANNMGTAKKLANKIEEMSGTVLKIVTDSAELYGRAIVLSKSGDSRAKELLKASDDDKVMIASEGTKIYIGSNSISYGDAPAVNAFISDVLGYDVALGKAKSENVSIDTIKYEAYVTDNIEEFIITHYFGIRPRFILNADGTLNTQRIDEAKEAGMNLIVVQYFDTATNKKVLEYCEKIGLRCTVYDDRINHVLYSEQLPENWEELLESVVEDYKGYRSLYYYGICDEPSEERFERIRIITQYLEQMDPARGQYVNHFPQHDDKMYDRFMSKVGTEILSYDRYVFNEKDDSPGFFILNLECARNVGLKYGVDYMAILLLTKHHHATSEYGYRYLTKEDLSWQAYMALAYGVSEVSYFTYWTPSQEEDSGWIWSEGMMSVDGERNQHYYDVQDIMKRFTVIANALVDKTSLGIFHTREYKVPVSDTWTTTSFTGYDTVKNIIADDAAIGVFDDDMMLIANGSYTEAMDVEIVTDSKLLMLDTQTGEWNELKGNKLNIAAGSGELIKIVK